MKSDLRLPRREQGIILIVTLLLLVFVLAIVGGLFYRHQINLQKVGKTLTSEQAILLLLSAETWAQTILEKDGRESKVDHLSEPWARNLPVLPIEGGKITGCLIDYQGMFNINDLGWYTIKSWEDELNQELRGNSVLTRRTLFKRLLGLLELENSDTRIASVVDWIDVDAWVLTPESAEDNEYLLLKPAYRPANFPIGDISELSLVMGFDANDVYHLQSHLSSAPELTPVNVNTATPITLQAMIEDITQVQLADFQERRPFYTMEEFYFALSDTLGLPVESLTQTLPSQLLTIKSNYFLFEAMIDLGTVKMAFNSLIERKADRRSVIHSRTFRYLPRVSGQQEIEKLELAGCQKKEVVQS